MDERIARKDQAKVSSRPRLKERSNPLGVRLRSRGNAIRTEPLVGLSDTKARALSLDKLLEEIVKSRVREE